ncbi:hypothetical protein [Schinkia azotoformans]|nr:hypothetical protein [Schinkia azotoformans]MEC1714727.1 hypothetical protein [Schinkia azotoformans]
MYFVIKMAMIGVSLEKYENLNDAQDRIKELYEKGFREVYLSQEIPMKVKVTVEF